MELNSEALNFEQIFLYNKVLYKIIFSRFEASPFSTIWLEICINWHTKSQGPMSRPHSL